jgi:tripartite-type tricarboxylate transporter receptor subunit TctC
MTNRNTNGINMMRPALTVGVFLTLALAALGGASAVAQQPYPSRPIRIVVPLPPGANGDLMPRILGQHLAAKLGQPVVIENRPGAAQNLGAELVYRSEPDGHTLLATPQGPLVISQSFFPKLGFDPREFVPITIMARLPYILVVHPKLPVKTFAEFIAYAKAHPNTLNDASPSTGSGPHLTGEMLKLASGMKTTHVPYSGMAPALNDLIAGHVEMMFDNLGNSLPLVKEGKLRGLAVTSEQRAPEIPELPAIAETYPEVVATSWFGVVAPPKTSPEIAHKLSRAFAEILRDPEVVRRWRELTLTPVGGTPEEIAAFFKEEAARWRRVIVAGGIKPE